MANHPEEKICPVCGRPFQNRKKWKARGQWDQIVYCSRRCRGAAGGSGLRTPGSSR